MNGQGKDWFFYTRSRMDLTPRQSEILRLKDRLTVLVNKPDPSTADLREVEALTKSVGDLEDLEARAGFACVACDTPLDDEGTYCAACTAAYEDVLGRCDHG
jgi:hypothetical protein